MRLGGSWRTRYFAVRAVRIIEELSAQRLQLRYCPTKVMAADGLTKLATGQVMQDFRDILHSKPFEVPAEGAEFKLTNSSPTACAVLATAATFDNLPMIVRRRRANEMSMQLVTTGGFVDDEQVREVLLMWGFARNTHRPNIAPRGSAYVHSECFGLVYDRTGRWIESTVTRMYPWVARCLNAWLRTRLAQLAHVAFRDPCKEWRWSAITVNRGYAAERHVDRNNYGPSIIRSFADKSDRLLYWAEGTRSTMSTLDVKDALRLPISSDRSMYSFDGTRPHETAPYRGQVESRLSIVFFQSNRGWDAPEPVTEGLSDLGFSPADSLADARRFASRYELLADGCAYASWPVSSVDDA